MTLKDVLGSFLKSYAQRDTDMAFSDWLADRLCQELPEMESETSTRLTDAIIQAVEDYDQTLNDLNRAIDAGQSKEEWLSEKLAEVYDDMPINEAGNSLQNMEDALFFSNMQIMSETDGSVTEETSAEEESVEWDKQSLKFKTYNIGKQLDSLSLCTAASAMEGNLNGDKSEISDAVADLFRKESKASSEEIKAVVAGAVQVCAEKGLTDELPSDISTEEIGDMASVAVEIAKAMHDAANGDISLTEAMDKIGRAVVAAGCRAGAGFLRGLINVFPGGPILVELLGGLLNHIESSQFINNVYTTFRNAAVAAWEGVKKSKVGKAVGKAFGKAKQMLFG